MRHNFNLTVTFAAVLTLTLAQPLLAASCSAAKVAGQWAFTTNGVLLTGQGSVPVASVGEFSVDGSGNFEGKQTRNIGGQVAQETISGTGTINSDCSGSLTVNVFDNGTLVRTTTLSAQWSDDMNKEDAIFTSVVLKPSNTSLPNVVTLHARRLTSRD